MTTSDYTPAIADALPPGYRFDEFEIQDVLQTTPCEIIYRAWDHQLERAVIIREYMPRAMVVRSDDMHLTLRSQQDHPAYSAGLAAFIQDARRLAKFNYPELVQVLRFWTENDTAYTVTRYYSGITLAELHQQQPDVLDEEWVRRILPMLCGALAALHAEGVIHRDLSPKSIQIQDNGVPLLLTFGVSRPQGDEVRDLNTTMLHAGYAPLEQYSSDLENQIGPWTDIYALGAVLYTLITGVAPPASVTRSIQDNCIRLTENPPAGWSPALLRAVDQALALKPEARPQSIDAFAALAEINTHRSTEIGRLKKTGTMLVPVEEDAATAKPLWARAKTPLQVAAGVLVGVIVGALLFRGEPADLPETPPTATATPTATPVTPTPAGGLIARVYIRMSDADRLLVNGKPQKAVAASSGFAFIQLPAGKYDITLQSGSQTHTQSLAIATPGTWLINPQG